MIYTTDLFQLDCATLAKQVSSFSFNYILSVQRGGGYVTNELVKHLVNKSFKIIDIKVSYYNGQNKREQPIINYPSCKVFKDTDSVLVLDDLCDGGNTLKYISEMYILKKCKFKTAVLIKKPTSIIDPDFCVHKNVTSWVRFMWEDGEGNHISDSCVSYTDPIVSISSY